MQYEIPEFLYNKLVEEYGEEITKNIVQGYKNKTTTIRVNTLKSNAEEIKAKLKSVGIMFREVSWNSNAIIIENAKEKEIQSLEIYQNGEIYMQNLSSMIPPIVVNPKERESILDMAAAPGGKTTQMSSLSNNLAMITACEKNKIRAERLKYNIEKQGASKVTVMLQDARDLSDFFKFDKILLDAPCSGSGTLNIEKGNIEKYFTLELIKRSIQTQKQLLKKAVNIVKTNGEIIYSTCSILKEENEKILEEILKTKTVEIEPIDKTQFTEIPMLPTSISGTICVCPNELYEGFFVAKLKKVN